MARSSVSLDPLPTMPAGSRALTARSTCWPRWSGAARSPWRCASPARISADIFTRHISTRCTPPTLCARPPRSSSDEAGARIYRARDKVWRALLAVGGLNSAGGSCLWHVIGFERALKEWALTEGWNGRRITQETASGIVIAALGALEAHFNGADAP